MKLSIIVVKFLFIGALLIIANFNLHLRDPAEREAFVNMYTDWLHSLFLQGKEVTGYVIKFEWMPGADQTIHVDEKVSLSG